MSLNAEERQRTSRELQHTATTAGLTSEQIAHQLGWSAARTESTLAVDSASHPVDVWELRDFLEETATGLGAEGVPFTVLTEAARRRARLWFALRRPPKYTPAIGPTERKHN